MNKKYKKNFLKGVLAKIDFSVPIPDFDTGLKADFVKKIIKLFPLKESNKLIGQELQFAVHGVQTRNVEKIEWFFYGKDREKKLSINENSMFVEFTKYETYTKLKEDFTVAVDALYDSYPELAVNRFGLRYVNNIDLREENPLEWLRFLDAKLLNNLQMPFNMEFLSRFFTSLDFNFSNMNLRFQYGNHNPDYPAPIKRKLFVLDFDAYLQIYHEKKDIFCNLDIFHSKIEEYFESCITQEFRDYLDE